MKKWDSKEKKYVDVVGLPPNIITVYDSKNRTFVDTGGRVIQLGFNYANGEKESSSLFLRDGKLFEFCKGEEKLAGEEEEMRQRQRFRGLIGAKDQFLGDSMSAGEKEEWGRNAIASYGEKARNLANAR